MISLRDLMRPDLAALPAYPVPPTIAELESRLGKRVVKLDSNENPYGPSPRIFEALSTICAERYPDAESTLFREALGGYLSVDPGRIVCSVGGDEMIDLILRLFLEPGDEVIDLTPSFVMYALTAAYNNGRAIAVPRKRDSFAVDVDAVKRAITSRTKVIFLCSPNNPTGNSTPEDDIVAILELGRIVVLDEAYAEFAGRTLVHLLDSYPNLIILRTMSKWAALAGIRLGYAVTDPALVLEIRKIKSPYNVGIAAQVAGVASIRDREYLMGNVRRIVEERERLRSRLIGLRRGCVFPSETNYLYWTPDGVPAAALKAALTARGVLVRAFHNPVDALRISVGTPEESDVLLAALEDAFDELCG